MSSVSNDWLVHSSLGTDHTYRAHTVWSLFISSPYIRLLKFCSTNLYPCNALSDSVKPCEHREKWICVGKDTIALTLTFSMSTADFTLSVLRNDYIPNTAKSRINVQSIAERKITVVLIPYWNCLRNDDKSSFNGIKEMLRASKRIKARIFCALMRPMVQWCTQI